MIIGTPLYLAPELIQDDYANRDSDSKSDMWALGVIIFALLAASHPFKAPPKKYNPND